MAAANAAQPAYRNALIRYPEDLEDLEDLEHRSMAWSWF